MSVMALILASRSLPGLAAHSCGSGFQVGGGARPTQYASAAFFSSRRPPIRA
jgi:hypothetical protein